MLNKQQKQIITTGLIFIIVITILFFSVKRDYLKSYNTTLMEIAGLKKIAAIYKVDITLKMIRGISQLNEQDACSLKESLFIEDDEVLNDIIKLNDPNIEKFYLSIVNNKNKLDKLELFIKYTNLLKMLKNKRIDIADTSHLLLDSNREIYFLVLTTVIDFPQITEYIGRIRALGAALINQTNKADTDKIIFLLNNNLKMFYDKIEEIRHTIDKLNLDDKNKLNTLLSSIISDFYNLKSIVNKIIEQKIELDSKEYFLTASKLVNKIYNLFEISKEIVTEKLQIRKKNLHNKILLGNIFYGFLLLIILFLMIKLFMKSKLDFDIERRKIEERRFIENMQNNYMFSSDLKEFCHKSLCCLIDYSKSLNGSLYLYDSENKKLYLGAAYGIKSKELEETLDLHENLLSENIFEKKSKIVHVNNKIDLGNVVVNSTNLITLPVIELEKNIGVIQLLFDKNLSKSEIEILESAVNVLGTYISKSQKNEESLKYLQLIDKNVLISKTDLNGNITEVSEKLCELTQYNKEELIGRNHRILRHPDMKDEIFKNLWKTISEGNIWQGEIKDKKKDGSSFWTYTYISPDYDINNNIIGYTAIRTDITNKKKLEEIAITDSLTSLYNRRHFDTIFKQQLSTVKRYNSMLAFVIIDIDHFKQYNDIYGHQKGDFVLKQVALAIKNTLKRANDFAFRLGGEEFGLLFHAKSIDAAKTVSEAVRQSVENLKIIHNGNTASSYVTISLGLYVIDKESNVSVDDIYKKADDALYKSKENGRNKITVAN